MIRLTKEQVLSIYGILIKKTGGSSGVLNESSIDSALNNICRLLMDWNCIQHWQKKAQGLDTHLSEIIHFQTGIRGLESLQC